MAIDLSALDDAPASHPGTPLELPINDIEEDPAQPRTYFDPSAMAAMVASIGARGVRQPVSVRRHPARPGKWILNFGARRLRASIEAGRKTIPAFLDETADDYDQVAENEQRDNLRPMELAIFIRRKLDEGAKRAEVARRLQKDASQVTHLLALLDAPAIVADAYRDGRCTSPKTLYELRALYEAHADEVEAWASERPEITRASVAELGARLKAGPSPAEDPHEVEPLAPASLGHDQEVPSLKRPVAPARARAQGKPRAAAGLRLRVLWRDQLADVQLDRISSTAGMLWLRFDDGDQLEVAAGDCSILELVGSG